MQSKPTGQPEVLQPSFEKLDLQKLMNDVPKYVRAGLPHEKMTFWENLKDKLHSMTASSSGPSIINALRKRREQQCETQDNNGDLSISSNVLSALEKDRAPLPEVL